MWQVKEAIDKCVIFLKKKEIPQADGIWKYNDINNGNNRLIEESFKKPEDNRERFTQQSSRQRHSFRYSVREHHLSAEPGPKYPSDSW